LIVQPGQKLTLMTALTRQSGGDLELFFSSYGLGPAFASPSKGWGKAKRIGAAFAAAEKRGDSEAILLAAAKHFGLMDPSSVTEDQAAGLDDLDSGGDAIDADDNPSSAARRSPAGPSGGAEEELRRLAFDAWEATREWPKARVLQRAVERAGGRTDIEATARKLDRGVGHLEQNNEVRVVLRIGGLIRTPGAERYVSAFIDVLQLAYTRYRDAEDDATSTLSDEVLRQELSLDPDMTRRLYALLEGEWFLLEGGSSSPDGTWRRDISPVIRHFRDVRTGEDYVRAANELVRSYASQPDIAAEEQAPSKTPPPSAATQQGTQIFNTVIFGGTASIGTNPSVVVSVSPGDLSGLMRFLEEHGVASADRTALAAAIAADEEEKKREKPGTRVTAWLGRVALKLAGSGGRIGEETAAALIAAAVARYLGLI